MCAFVGKSARIMSLGLTALLASQVQAAPVCTAPANLVANGGFEQGDFSVNGFPDAWSWDAYAHAALPIWDNSQAREGEKSVKISAGLLDDARWIQSVPIQRNTPHSLSGWIKAEDVALSPEIIDVGANLSLLGSVLGGFTHSPTILGTRDWTRTGVLFNSESNDRVTVAARLGYYAGTTTGTAWFDEVRLAPIVPMDPHPRWNILVLIYRNTDFVYTDSSGIRHHVVASMAQHEVEQAADAARQFVEKDIPALTSANILPRLTIRYPERALTTLGPNGGGWWPAPGNTAEERDPAFDSVIVIWDPRATDQDTGKPIWIGSAAGLTPAMGTGQTYMTLIIEAAIYYGHRNVFKHEWGHSILEYFDAIGTAPKPKVENHTDGTRYVNCRTGSYYVWADEMEASPIPNSIYNNESGFTHDYYSGTTARSDEPARCLGIPPEAWAFGGPVSHSENQAVFTPTQRVLAIGDQVNALVVSDQLAANQGWSLGRRVQIVNQALVNGEERTAALELQKFIKHIQQLLRQNRILPHAGELLIAAAHTAMACLPTS